MKMKSRTRTIIELVIIIVMAVWLAFMTQWLTRNPSERLGPGAHTDAPEH
jgi:hypothetical protein